MAKAAKEELRAKLLQVLKDHAVDSVENQGTHSWRCRYPESYGKGPCDCIDRLLDDLVEVARGKTDR